MCQSAEPYSRRVCTYIAHPERRRFIIVQYFTLRNRYSANNILDTLGLWLGDFRLYGTSGEQTR